MKFWRTSVAKINSNYFRCDEEDSSGLLCFRCIKLCLGAISYILYLLISGAEQKHAASFAATRKNKMSLKTHIFHLNVLFMKTPN